MSSLSNLLIKISLIHVVCLHVSINKPTLGNSIFEYFKNMFLSEGRTESCMKFTYMVFPRSMTMETIANFFSYLSLAFHVKDTEKSEGII